MACIFFGLVAAPLFAPASARGAVAAAAPFDQQCRDARGARGKRVVCADLVGLDQMLVYNRFGSFNPFGMIFALRRDVVPMSLDAAPGTVDCGADTGTHSPAATALSAGEVRLRDCRRPRPIVLRANVGDLMYLRVTNLLAPGVGPADLAPRDLSDDFCNGGASDDYGRALVWDEVSRGDASVVDHAEVLCRDTPSTAGGAVDRAPDWPRTRSMNMVIQGLMPLSLPDGQPPHPACFGLDAVAPGESFACLYEVVQEGTHFLSSRAAPSGGEGDGGSITHGLFGAVMAERPGTRWYRSQVSEAAMNEVWKPLATPRHARDGALNYEKQIGDVPVLNLARAVDGAEFRDATAIELVHSDLNAIIWCDSAAAAAQGRPDHNQPLGCAQTSGQYGATVEPTYSAYREFSVFFHDELKTFYTRNFQELGHFGQLAGVRDGFAINYGASGMGTLLLANRKGIGPAASCMECLYEEFFLSSWANGDPALLEWYADDPSNVHHSYLNDPVVFRNFHAGPKETHVFHLHAHQWFAGNDPGRGSYLDSQTVAPGQGFTYNIYHGGRQNGQGGAFVAGSGNRNRTVGDSIFHCHLYPHFAQGMWALWRVHDVFEDGSRKLPDGQFAAGLSADIRRPDEASFMRLGSVDPRTGAWLDTDDPATVGRKEGEGTPIPALVPLPGEPLPPLPSYAAPTALPDDTPTAGDQASLKAPAQARPALRRSAASLPGRQGVPVRLTRDLTSPWNGPERLLHAQATVAPPPSDAVPPIGAAPEVAPPDVASPAPPAMIDAVPGYPFFIPGLPGHRPPQAPLDIARKLSDPATGAGRVPTNSYLSGGLGRHVVTSATRKLDYLSPETVALDAKLAAEPGQPEAGGKLETLRSQIVATALALGDMTAHLEKAEIDLLDPEGQPLERAAQAFHHDGAGLTVLQPDGKPVTAPQLTDAQAVPVGAPVPLAPEGAYQTLIAPLPGSSEMAVGHFHVNGAPAAPGAPFADPCGGAPTRDNSVTYNDPFVQQGADYVTDPALLGFRRYEVSAVQLDLVVNQAGWHDPQARIDVLTTESHLYKDKNRSMRERISPRVDDDSTPFFFRAISGECIEFRHTNELPKDLQLDDFQVKTPTDTVGQHIHLVKFDVTASDGSGNGWNYEDGTFAADELMARRCANLALDHPLPSKAEWGFTAATQPLCDAVHNKEHQLSRIWRLPMNEAEGSAPPDVEVEGMAEPVVVRDLFQTTVQRWFADPILTNDGASAPQDRTMRTVFSHDHFGPSSIQQHGFYTALLIEPGAARVCDPHVAGACTAPVTRTTPFVAADAGADWIGSHKVILSGGAKDPYHPDYREFALAVADFALLYDPRDREDIAALDAGSGGEKAGMIRLDCEAQLAASGRGAEIGTHCNALESPEPEIVPAWWAAGAPGDQDRLNGNILDADKVKDLREHLVRYRSRAASPDGQAVAGPVLAKPVAPPMRPESISVDHHDPYLVNYRNAPVPLRLGTKNSDGTHSVDCDPLGMTPAGRAHDDPSEVVTRLLAGTMPQCSYRYQLAGLAGDAAYALSSWTPEELQRWATVPDMAQSGGFPSREPETPRFEAYQDERLMFRLIQGAQEVQHSFNIMGLATPRNVDQRYGRGMRPLAVAVTPARQACFEVLSQGHPEWYDDWLNRTPNMGVFDDADVQAENAALAPDKAAFFDAMDEALANCDNLDGYTFAQEIGISEHFEIRGRLRSDLPQIETVTPAEPNAQMQGGAGGVPVEASDYLYNLGTVDALWNGAWGLLRVYSGEPERTALLSAWQHARDSTASDKPVSLPSLTQTRTAAAAASGAGGSGSATGESAGNGDPGIAAVSAGAAGCPLPTDARAGHNTAVLLVALRTAEVFSGGTGYGADRSDPDGLMLAALNPDSLPFANGGKRDIGVDTDWSETNRPKVDQVLAAVKDAYAAPEPLVIRVNAGDCVSVRYINTLREADLGAGLPDGLGDALMPLIVPLNTDPRISVSRVTTAAGTRVDGRLHATTVPVTGLRPSARLGLSIGLPGGDLIRALPLGYGINAGPMEPAGNDSNGSDGAAEVSTLLTFYAGRMRIALPEPETGALAQDPILRLAQDSVNAMQDQLNEWLCRQPVNDTMLCDADDFFSAIQRGPGQSSVFAVLGKKFTIGVAGGNEDLSAYLTTEQRGQLQAMAAYQLNKHIHWIPYAFGPVPVRVSGDMISQPPHGLFGVIDVLPRDWTIPEALAPAMGIPASADFRVNSLRQSLQLGPKMVESADPPGLTWRSAAVAPMPAPGSGAEAAEFGAPALYEQARLAPHADGAQPGGARIREFVIVYQDGLNHRDHLSKINWELTAEGEPAEVADAVAGHALDLQGITPNCAVCDDSYDWGEQGVSYRSRPFASLLRDTKIAGDGWIEASDDLNAIVFPDRFLDGRTVAGDALERERAPLTLRACPGEQVLIRVVHPGGRARQRAFAMTGAGYDDLFPGFGFPNAALLAPGKTVSAWLYPADVLGSDGTRVPFEGKLLWHDGPTFLMAGGTWGLVSFEYGGAECPRP